MKRVLSISGISIGAIIFAFGLKNFIIASNLAEGGFTGVALTIHYFTGWPTGIILFMLNIPLIIISWKKLGKDFFFNTLLGVFIVSFAIDIIPDINITTKDLLFSALYGGVFSGIGLGIIFRSGGSTGGVDIIARLIHDYNGISMGKVFLVFDLIVLSMVAVFFGLEISLYSLVTVYLFSHIVDRIVEGFNHAKAVTIITPSASELAHVINKDMDRGATIMQGIGSYTREQKDILYVIVSKHQLLRLKNLVRQFDPKAFIIVNDVYEVLGEGFKRSGI